MREPLVSIVTTSFNRAHYLGSTIESVLAQDHADFEYVIIDDCSPDDSLGVARSYEGDPRLRVIANATNLGDYGNRNKGLSLARGKYVKFVDCDDLLYPHCVGAMLEVAEAFPDAGVVFSTRERPPWRYPVQLSPEQVYRLHFTAGGVLHQGALSSLLRRDAILAVGGFPDIYTGDVACWLNLAREYPVALMGGGLFWWREHAGQLSETLRSVSVKWAIHQVEGVRLHWAALGHRECPLPAAECTTYQRRIGRDYLGLMVRNGLRGRVRVFNELRRGCPFGLAAAMASLKAPVALTAEIVPVRPEPAPTRPSLRATTGKVARAGQVPFISVLLPVADGEENLRDTIESIITQDYGDWELIVVDDASEDGTSPIAASYNDGMRVRLIRNATRKGTWAAHNQCVGEARGRYLKFIHAGDALERSALRAFAWYAARFPKVGLFISCADERLLMPQELSPEGVYQAESMGILSMQESPSGTIYEREAWARADGFDPDSPDPVGRLHLEIGRNGTVVFIPGGSVSYAHGSEALRISSTRGAGRSDAGVEVLRNALNAADCPLSERDRQAALTGLSRHEKRAKWERICGRWAVARRMIRIIYPEMPPLAVAAKLGGDEASFDRSLYPGAEVAGGGDRG